MSASIRWTHLTAAGLIFAATLGLGHAASTATTATTATNGGISFSLRRPYNAKAAAPGEGPLVKTSAGTAHLAAGHYEDVRDAALAMMAKYPPSSHYYLALGRSPVSIYTFLRALSPKITSTFPASDLRLGISEEHHGAYFDHFAKYIPREVLEGKRGDIVIYDRSHDHSGSSLALLKPLLEQFLKKKGYQTKVIALGFAGAGPLQSGVRYMSTKRFPQVFLYFNGADHDEAVATYVGKHTIGTHLLTQHTQNPGHARVAAAMGKRLAADQKLDELLSSEPHLKGLVSAR